jgi:hypothetical protein
MVEKLKAFLFIGDDAAIPEKLYFFREHWLRNVVVLESLVERSNQKIASRNLKYMLDGLGVEAEQQNMLQWREKEVWRVSNLL